MTSNANAAWLARAREVLVGGVNSPVRAFGGVGGDPILMVRGRGSRMWDVDGREYIDYIGSWGPLILGHGDPEARAALIAAAEAGTSFGATSPLEIEMAEMVRSFFPGCERVRMVNSGTEATMSAIRLARGFTGRDRVLKFEGCYHGHGDPFLVKAGSGLATLGISDSRGVPAATAAATLVAPFNALEAVETIFARHGSEIAGVIVEPVAGNMGTVAPEPGFLEGLRRLCTAHGALLIFDEVMTGFRVAPGGAQERFGVTPDLTTLGKIIGGGLPVGAYGGRREIMDQVSPSGPVYQAGTLSGNPLAMATGLATLRRLREPGFYERLEAVSARLARGLLRAAADLGVPAVLNRVGSMMTLFFTGEPVRDFASAKRSDTARFAAFFHGLLRRGVHLPPSQFEALFVSAAHSEADIEATIAAARGALGDLRQSG
ncbi:MAG: glutamate-1-semialdehyde 2,1-aminomutase [Candidatus Sumerlaeia bacterium]|nr:glutamate-1-semialdehyde 2,1-aminomutase [Candidatus Sumerlaeia bacterium]